jgi:glycosyltransferase involved in cell wall biosynthesis
MVATDIFSHTQVLSSECAELVAPEAKAIAEGIERLADDPTRRQRLAEAAVELAREKYSEEAYHSRLNALLQRILDRSSASAAV